MTFVDRRFMGWSNGVGYGGQAAIVRIVDEVAVISVTSGVAARLEVVDPAFIRSRRGVRAVCATRAGVGDDGGGNVRVRRRRPVADHAVCRGRRLRGRAAGP